MKQIRLLLMMLWLTSVGHGSEWFVAPGNAPGGSGSKQLPWSLQAAATNSAIRPGDTVWLRGGVYFPVYTNAYLNGALGWTFGATGTSNNLVTFRSYSNEWAAIDRRALVASYIRFQDLEFYDSLKGHNPTNSKPEGPWVHFVLSTSVGDEWINCVIHDVGNCWGSAYSAQTIRGCILWYVGWNAVEHVCYPNPARFEGNIVAFPANRTLNNSADLTVAGYNGDVVCTSNIIFGAGMMDGERDTDLVFGNTTYKATIVGNYCYNTNASIQAAVGPGSVLSNNTVTGSQPVLIAGSGNITFKGNTVYANAGDGKAVVNYLSGITNGWSVDYNNYYCSISNSISFIVAGAYGWTLNNWQTTNHFDTHASDFNSATHPPDSVMVVANKDALKRAHIGIYNWTRSDNVAVNLSGVLNAGDTYEVYSAQNYNAGAIQSGIYDGTSISVPMTNLTTAPILYGTNMNYYGQTIVQPAPTSPIFGAFMVKAAKPSPPRNVHISPL